MGAGLTRGSPHSAYQSTEFYTNLKGSGTSTIRQDPRQLFGNQPHSRLRGFFYYFYAPSDPLPREGERADAPGGARNSISPLSTSPFSLSFFLSCCLSLLPFLFFFPYASSSPPFPASSPGRIPASPPLLRLRAPLPSPLLPTALAPRSRPHPAANQRAAFRGPAPAGRSGRARRSPGRGCGGRRRGAGADGAWRTGGAGAGLAWTRVCGAVRGRGGRCGPPGMGQPWPGGAEPEARAARGPGLPGERPGG